MCAATALTMCVKSVAIMHHERVDVSITGNSLINPFSAPSCRHVQKDAGTREEVFLRRFGRRNRYTLHPDNMAAGRTSYGMTDTMGRMHSDAQFAGSVLFPRMWK